VSPVAVSTPEKATPDEVVMDVGLMLFALLQAAQETGATSIEATSSTNDLARVRMMNLLGCN